MKTSKFKLFVCSQQLTDSLNKCVLTVHSQLAQGVLCCWISFFIQPKYMQCAVTDTHLSIHTQNYPTLYLACSGKVICWGYSRPNQTCEKSKRRGKALKAIKALNKLDRAERKKMQNMNKVCVCIVDKHMQTHSVELAYNKLLNHNMRKTANMWSMARDLRVTPVQVSSHKNENLII